MKKKNLVVLITVVAFLFVSLSSLAPTANSGSTTAVVPFVGQEAMDLTPEMLGEEEMAIRRRAAEVGSAIATGASPIGEPAEVGDEFTFTVSDNGLGFDYDEDFVVENEGEHGLILITKDAYDSFDGTAYHFANPIGDDSEIWLRSEDLITPEQIQYLADEFDNNMWPTVTTVYGEPLARGEEGQKVWTLLFNIRDDAYYNPDATSYIAGYFSASESAENNKNIMHIDTYNWEDRTGPDSARPYLYEGTFAHEFEHLVHFDIDPDEPSWVDEGLADLAGFLCGYGHSESHLAYYMVYHPFTSLTFWGSGLEDYGASYLFQLYLFEKYGGAEFISALVDEQANGIEGIESTLDAFGYCTSFDAIYDRWTIANYIDDTSRWCGKYGYETLDIGSVDTWGYTIPYALRNFWWGPEWHVDADSPFSSDMFGGSWYGPIQPYTAHYWEFTNDKITKISLDGDDFAGTPAYSGTYEWYSDAAAWAWRSFYQTFAIPAGGATLDFMTYFDIEGDWDYGYVEVYNHDDGSWSTLDAAGTVNYVAHGQDNPSTPDEREPTTYEAAGTWHAFTGFSGGWMPVSMDLTPFAGDTIDIYFTTWQDGAFTLQMMYVDDISIPEIGFFDDIEAGEGGWTSTGWYVTDGILDNGWDATVIRVKNVNASRYVRDSDTLGKYLWRRGMWMDSATQSGTMYIGATKPESDHLRVAIVSNKAGHILPGDYVLSLEEHTWKKFKWWRHWC